MGTKGILFPHTPVIAKMQVKKKSIMRVHGNPIFLLNYMENTILTDIICKVADRVKAAIKKQKFVKKSFYLKLLDTHVLSPSMKLTLSW